MAALHQPMLGYYLAEPPGAQLGCAFLAYEIHVDDPKTPVVAVLPLEVIHERPQEITMHGHAVGNGTIEFLQTAPGIFDAVQVENFTVIRRRFIVSRPILRDENAFLAIDFMDMPRAPIECTRSQPKPGAVGARIVLGEWNGFRVSGCIGAHEPPGVDVKP